MRFDMTCLLHDCVPWYVVWVWTDSMHEGSTGPLLLVGNDLEGIMAPRHFVRKDIEGRGHNSWLDYNTLSIACVVITACMRV